MPIIKEKSPKDLALYQLYHNSKDYSLFLKNVDNYLASHYQAKVSGCVLTTVDNIFSILNTKISSDYLLHYKNIGDQIFSCKISKKDKKTGVEISGEFLLIKHNILPNIFLVLTHERIRVFNSIIMNYFNDYYPKILRSYMDSDYLKNLLVNFENRLSNSKIRITRTVTKGWLKSEGSKKKVESKVTWTDVPFIESYQQLLENEQWIKSLDFTVKADRDFGIQYIKSPLYKLTRDGRFQCNCNFILFYERIIEGITNNASDNYLFFNKRQRKKENNYKPKPLTIVFDKDIFKDKIQNQLLTSTLTGIKYSSVSIYHANPYFHASYVDYQDGSSCDIWVLSENKITIVPQMRSTVAALERLCECIFTTFREGKIMDLSESYEQ